MTEDANLRKWREKQPRSGSVVRIYVLRDPRTGFVRYVGKTTASLAQRLSEHIGNAVRSRNRTHCTNWVFSLLADGIRPQIEQIDSACADWMEREAYWIQQYRDSGSDLTNHAEGGQGPAGCKRSREWCAALGKRSKDNRKEEASTEAGRAKLASRLMSIVASPEWRQWQSDRVRHWQSLPEVKARQAAFWTEDNRSAQAERTRGQWTPERRAAASEKARAQRAREMAAKHLRKVSADG